MSKPEFRAAQQNDCTHLALLADMATRRLTSHLWGLTANAGQSAFEVGRSIIRNDTKHFSLFTFHFSATGAGQSTLLVGSFNARVHKLYLRCGFEECARRPFTTFPGSDRLGEWVLMRKVLPT